MPTTEHRISVICPACRWTGRRVWQGEDCEHTERCACAFGACPKCKQPVIRFAAWQRIAVQTAICRYCRRSRPMSALERQAAPSGYIYVCRDEVDCSVATQWSTGGNDGR